MLCCVVLIVTLAMLTMYNLTYALVSSPDLLRYGFSDDRFLHILVVEDRSGGEGIQERTLSWS